MITKTVLPTLTIAFAVALPRPAESCPVHLHGRGHTASTSMTPAGGSSAPGASMTMAAATPLGKQQPKPDLVVDAIYMDHATVDVGEDLVVNVVVENAGSAVASNVELEVCLDPATCQNAAFALPIPPGGRRTLTLPFPTGPSSPVGNPYWITATVDPNDTVDESNETNNQGDAHKPGFVVNVQYAPPVQPDEHDDIIEIQNGQVVSFQTIEYGPNGGESDNFQFQDPDKGSIPEPQPGSVPPQPRISPVVAQADAAAQPGEMLEYLVLYEHAVPMAALPQLPDQSERFSQQNISVIEQRLAQLEGTRRLRVEAAASIVQALEAAGGSVIEYFAMGGVLHVSAPKGHLAALNLDPLVRHVEPMESATFSGTTSDARAIMNTDVYYNNGYTGGGYIGVIDSGVRDSHDILDTIGVTLDCATGNSDCEDTGSAAYDPTFDERNHGTSVCAIIGADSSYGSTYRGFCGSVVDSFKVCETGSSFVLSTTAILRAMEQAVEWHDRIVNLSFGSNGGPSGTLSSAADDLFDSGVIVIAANGNDGGGFGTVDAPANAHKVMGVGAVDVDWLTPASYQSEGPTPDIRYKPDFLAPTNSVTADAWSDTSLSSFGGTSSAAPCAVGAAAVFSDLISSSTQSVATAGKTYASLINSGPLEWGEFNNTDGVGVIELPSSGKLILGSRNLTKWDNDYVTFDVPSYATKIACAIWWPEDHNQSHRDMDLYLQKPDGSISDSSYSSPSVFEHLDVGSVASGTRKIQIYCYQIPPSESQTVYFSIIVYY